MSDRQFKLAIDLAKRHVELHRMGYPCGENDLSIALVGDRASTEAQSPHRTRRSVELTIFFRLPIAMDGTIIPSDYLFGTMVPNYKPTAQTTNQQWVAPDGSLENLG